MSLAHQQNPADTNRNSRTIALSEYYLGEEKSGRGYGQDLPETLQEVADTLERAEEITLHTERGEIEACYQGETNFVAFAPSAFYYFEDYTLVYNDGAWNLDWRGVERTPSATPVEEIEVKI